MKNILPFSSNAPASKDGVRVQDAQNGTYSLSDMTEGSIDFEAHLAGDHGNVAPLAPAPKVEPRGWSNQDRASLMRAHRLLSLAGVPLETDDGLTDEGDPWFVFLDRKGEVFAHFARIDGMYVLDSLVQDQLISAPSLESLVSSFAQDAQPKDDVGAKILTFAGARRSQVRMHPGATLAALLWTVYLATDDMIGRAEAGPMPDLAADPELTDDTGPALPEADYVAPRDMDKPQDARETTIAPTGISAAQYVTKSIGLSLSALALGNGIYFWLVRTDPQSETVFSLADLRALANLPPEQESNFHKTIDAMQAPLAAAEEAIAQTTAPEPHDNGNTIDLVQDVAPLQVSAAEVLIEPETEIALDEIADDVPRAGSAPVTPKADEASQVADAQTEASETKVSSADVLAKIGEAQVVSGDLYEVLATRLAQQGFDPDQFLKPLASANDDAGEPEPVTVPQDSENSAPPLVTVATEQPAETVNTSDLLGQPNLGTFDNNVYSFLVFLLSKTDSTRRSDFGNEVILVDMDAFDEVSDVVYARSWQLEDGSIISTIGLKSDFETFGLLDL